MAYIYDLSDTWNAAGTTFFGIKMNVTNSASAAGSRLLSLQTGSVEQAWVGPTGSAYFAGNVGIGTSSPQSRFHVDAPAGSGSFFTGTGNYNGGYPTAVFGLNIGYNFQAGAADVDFFNSWTGATGAQGGFSFRRQTGASSQTSLMRIDGSGNVGIGTSSPDRKLVVSGASVSMGLYATNGSNMSIDAPVSGIAQINVSGSNALRINTNGAERFRIDSSGNLLVGSSAAPSGSGVNVQIAGNATTRLWMTPTSGRVYYLESSSSSNALQFIDGTAGAERMRITSGGNLLVGTTSTAAGNWINEFRTTAAGGWPLALNGNDRGVVIRNSASSSGFYAYFEYNGGTNNGSISWSGGTTAYNTTSDARIKDNIVDAPEAGDLIDGIKVRSWDFKADGAHWRYGMVAQELLEVAPEAVSVPADEEMMMGVDYSKLVPMLVKELQSVRARLAALEGN